MASRLSPISSAYLPPRLLAMGLGEFLIIGGCFLLAAVLRLGSDAYFMLNYQGGFLKIGLICLVCVLCLYFCDFYDSSVFSNRRELVTRTPNVIGWLSIALGILYYFYPPLGVGRGIFTLGIFLVAFGLIGYRIAFLRLSQTLLFAQNTLVLGDGVFARELAREIQKRPESGLRLLGLVSENGLNPGGGPDSGGKPQIVGTTQQLVPLVSQHAVLRLIVAMQDRRGKLPVNELLQLKAQGVVVEDGIQVYESLSAKIPLVGLTPGWLVFTEGFGVSPLQRMCIRLTSVSLALIGLVLSGPLMLLLALLIKLDSPGPVFFRQERVGKRGRIFHLLKFRSMRDNAESDTGPVWAQENDPRVTRVGGFMRKWRLDELPQFFNILRGEMNLVGPRPERPCFVEQLSQKIPFYGYRHMVRPGITGWAQVKYRYADTELSQMEKLQYDLFYCKHRSVGLDLLIAFHTAKIVLSGRGAR